MISMESLKKSLKTSLSKNDYDKFIEHLNDLEIDKDNFWNVILVVEEVIKEKLENTSINSKKDSKKVLLEEFGVIEKEHNFFDDLEDFKIKISNLFKNKLSNYKDDSLEDIYNKLDDFEGRLI